MLLKQVWGLREQVSMIFLNKLVENIVVEEVSREDFVRQNVGLSDNNNSDLGTEDVLENKVEESCCLGNQLEYLLLAKAPFQSHGPLDTAWWQAFATVRLALRFERQANRNQFSISDYFSKKNHRLVRPRHHYTPVVCTLTLLAITMLTTAEHCTDKNFEKLVVKRLL